MTKGPKPSLGRGLDPAQLSVPRRGKTDGWSNVLTQHCLLLLQQTFLWPTQSLGPPGPSFVLVIQLRLSQVLGGSWRFQSTGNLEGRAWPA